MVWNLCGFLVLGALAIGTALVVLALLRQSLGALLEDLVKLPACTVFYTRLLTIGAVFIALAAALGTEFDLKKEAAFMEYVWKVAGGLSTALGQTCLFLTGYLLVVTVLVAVLRRRRE